MPVFRKGKKTKDVSIGKEIYRVGSGRRLYFSPEKYHSVDVPRRLVERAFPNFFKENSFIEKRFSETGKPVVVLDWGCGTGRAIKEFAEHYGNKIKAYGFGKEGYPEMKNPGDAKLIQGTANDLLRYLKDGSVDFVYSYFGLFHLFTSRVKIHNPNSRTDGTVYIKKLLKKISPGGKIVFNVSVFSAHSVSELLKQAIGEEAEISVDPERDNIYITKKAA